jgi:hypothetical protein
MNLCGMKNIRNVDLPTPAGGILRLQHPLSIVLVVTGFPPLLVRNGRLRRVLCYKSEEKQL